MTVFWLGNPGAIAGFSVTVAVFFMASRTDLPASGGWVAKFFSLAVLTSTSFMCLRCHGAYGTLSCHLCLFCFAEHVVTGLESAV